MTMTRLTNCPVCGAECEIPSFEEQCNGITGFACGSYVRLDLDNKLRVANGCPTPTQTAIDALNAAQPAKDDAP